mmetsp:Transcript_12892/g.19324  ORF Transcript_12892/g.19324 Transcript_12892/m.19324 type:complete len:468 (+) Transcript_12892:161-1564(+)
MRQSFPRILLRLWTVLIFSYWSNSNLFLEDRGYASRTDGQTGERAQDLDGRKSSKYSPPRPKIPIEVLYERVYGQLSSEADSKNGISMELLNEPLSFPSFSGTEEVEPAKPDKCDQGFTDSSDTIHSENFNRQFDESMVPRYRGLYENSRTIYEMQSDKESSPDFNETVEKPVKPQEDVAKLFTDTSGVPQLEEGGDNVFEKDIKFLRNLTVPEQSFLMNTICRHFELGYSNLTDVAVSKVMTALPLLKVELLYKFTSYLRPLYMKMKALEPSNGFKPPPELINAVNEERNDTELAQIVLDYIDRKDAEERAEGTRKYFLESSTEDSYLADGYETYKFGAADNHADEDVKSDEIYGEDGFPIIISGLHYYATDRQVYRLIRRCGGTIVDMRFLEWPANGLSKGTCIVWLKHRHEVSVVIKNAMGQKLNGRNIRVSEYTVGGYVPSEQPPREVRVIDADAVAFLKFQR